MTRSEAGTLATLRRVLIGILLFALVGTACELLLMGHYEEALQLIPLGALATAIVASAAMAATIGTPAKQLTQVFRAVMVLLILTGAGGTLLHYRANREFKLEMDPSLRGLPLFWSVMRAKAPPAMAPGNLALFGLLGLASVFRLEDGRSAKDPVTTRGV